MVTHPLRRRSLLALLPALLLSVLLAACGRDVTIVGILEAELSRPMEKTRTGFLEALRDAGYKAGENTRFIRRNAEVREQPLDELAAELFMDEEVALLLALSTQALKASLSVDADTPIIFAMSGNPFAAQAEVSPAAWARVSGAVAPSPDSQTVALVQRLLPQARRLGILFSPSEPDSLLSSQLAQDAAGEGGLAVIATAVAAPSEVAAATQSLIAEGAQAIYVTPSAILEEEFSSIVEGADDAGVPVFATSGRLTDKGALASYEVDWEDNGRRAAALALRVLQGEPVSTLPIDTGVVYQPLPEPKGRRPSESPAAR